ncbi:MAG: bifunctional pyr operon transcriptional regulator/uracil phosphoribosyltransferase PyrR [Candidatus Dadabacteria bacterium]|nr:bifunctional pyr operon transcriptional regulator/uracil phosphoribosyltransferase PyrR [Candidatus Dadabacteria bacterium]NIQ16341.1 bifunctional pyr operon transcriptional regulator/uracil phosphoribosyltransferase PyrR [Candidatus Dadabacteria bacterium]
MSENTKVEVKKVEEFYKTILDSLKADDIQNLVVIGIKTRGVFLAKRFAKMVERKFANKVSSGTLDISLYRDDFKNKKSWPDIKKTEIPSDIEGKNILLFDDVLYTGRTVRAAINAIMDYGRPSSIKLAVMVDRGNRELPIQPDFVCMNVKTSANEMVNVYIDEVDNKEEVEIIRSNAV